MRLPVFLRRILTPGDVSLETSGKPAAYPQVPASVADVIEPDSRQERVHWTKAPEIAPAEDGDGTAETAQADRDATIDEILRTAHEARDAGHVGEARTILETAAQRFPDAASVMQDLAKLAEAERDWAGAEKWWRAYALLTPPAAWVVTHIAHFIRLQDCLSDAEAWVASALGHFPLEPALFIDHARMAEMRRDWPEAAARWGVVAERFPNVWEGLAGRARALREQGRADQARALLDRDAERYPVTAGLVQEQARVADAVRDWPAAERWWREAVTLEPDLWFGYVGLVNALREQRLVPEAEAVLTAQIKRVPHEAWPLIEYARLAERSADWPIAMDRWGEVLSRFPDRWEGYIGRARASRELGELVAARDVLIEAVARFPAMAQPVHDLAWLAETQRDWSAAEKWWRQYLLLQPDHWRGHTGLATALREQRRVPEAEAALASQFDRLGHEPIIFIEHARLAEWTQDWPEALTRWNAILSRFPDAVDGIIGQARALREHGRLDESWDTLEKAADRFPSAKVVHLEFARVAEARHDWPAAERGWRAFAVREPGLWWGYTGIARALREQGKIPEAEAVLEAQFTSLAGDAAIFVDYARLAEVTQDWAQAAKRWEVVARRFPTVSGARLAQARALGRQGDFAAATAILINLLEDQSTDPVPAVELARLLAASGDPVGALRQWKDICLRFPDLPGNRRELAGAAFAAQDFDLAEQTAAELRAADPSDVAGWFHAIACLRATRRSAEAEALLADAPPDVLRHHDIMGIWVTLPREAADWDEHLRRADLMMKLYPDSAKSHMHAIYAHSFVGDQVEAERCATVARSRWPDDTGLMWAECHVARQAGAWNRALPLLERLLERSPEDESYLRAFQEARRHVAEASLTE